MNFHSDFLTSEKGEIYMDEVTHIKDQQETQTVSEMVNPVEEQPAPLIKMDFLNDRISKSETETVSSDNRRKCRSDNK